MEVDPKSVGRYRIQARIAAGGMGEVFLASVETMPGVLRPVALKLVRPELAGQPGFAQLFVEEVRVAMSLSHANVVQAFDVGQIDARWFLAMEYVDGLDLSALLSRGPLPLGLSLLVAIEALKGLDYAHRRRGADGAPLAIVHRDVSPGNLLLSRVGEVKVADFGVAKSTLRDV
ncbi:MAG: serine/threonine-protein kinase, partial [Sandaracinaceae bacterium]